MIPFAVLAVIMVGLNTHLEFVTQILPTWEASNLNHSTAWILNFFTSGCDFGILFAVSNIKWWI